MDMLLNWLSTNYALTALVLLIAFVLGLIVFAVVIYRLGKLSEQYKSLMRGVEGKNLEQIIMKNTKTLEQVLLKLSIFEDRLNSVEDVSRKSVQKVGTVRFNAFNDMGGDLSYAIALLDQQGNGVVVSSIYGRDDARTYAKPIKLGKSTYQLSAEEEKAILMTLQEEQ